MDPLAEYQRRHQQFLQAHALLVKRFTRIGNLRLLLAVIASITLWFAPRLAVIPVTAFIVLVVWHQIIKRRRAITQRRISYYAEAIERVEDRWAGHGLTGDRFNTPDHVFADDLDLFGNGSLFQLLCRARTTNGEQTLARWLLESSAAETILQRQSAVQELNPALDLRADIALIGEEIKDAVHAAPLAAWGAAAPVPFPRFVRPFAAFLSIAAVATLLVYWAGLVPIFPFVLVLAIEIALAVLLRYRIAAVLEALETPANDLNTVALLIQRLESEQFQSPYLRQLHSDLQVEGTPASKRIARLRRWIELLDSTDHFIVRIIGPVVLWKPQIVFAIEHWRVENGPAISKWLSATGEIEALASLASLAYERPSWNYPELVYSPRPVFAATELRHPLIAASRVIPNSISLGQGTNLLIVSGSNMSGKSTLLRAIGLAAVLAWTGAPVPADKLILSSLQLGVSLRVSDSLQDNRSRFFAEIVRLRQIVDLSNGSVPLLFLLDELLSGTNSHDRRIGASAIVKSLVASGAIGLITTHDLALTQIADELPGQARNVHFQDEIKDDRIEFDYHLRNGVVTHSNALALMRAVGLKV